MRIVPKFRRAVLLIAPAAAVLALPFFGEVVASQTSEREQRDVPYAAGGAGMRPLAGTLLDRPVNRTEYQLGPGDAVDVAIFGDFNGVETLVVSPEGSLLIPSLGIVQVLGLDLDEAQERVSLVVRRFYRDVDVRLALSRVRTFKVFVVGDVADPGVREAHAAMRVSEVLGGLSPNAPTDERVRRRNVTLRRASGESVAVDLARFQQTGDLSANPTLREGDAVVVPIVDARNTLYGRVHYPGAYEYRKGETLSSLLSLANGGADFPADAADTVRVTRFEGGKYSRTFLISRRDLTGPAVAEFELHPFDAIFIPAMSDHNRLRTASVGGLVMRPGTYPIRPDSTTVRDLVEMAGGFAPGASLVGARLRRPSAQEVATTQVSEIPPEFLSREDRRILQTRSHSDATTVVVDFEALFAAGGDAYDVTLRPGDRLEVPEHQQTVTVLGAVRDPGIVAYVDIAGAEYFIQRAGGYARRADRRNAVVLHARTGTRTSVTEDPALGAGDTVIVPFREERTWLDTLQTTQAIAGTLTGLVVILRTIF